MFTCLDKIEMICLGNRNALFFFLPMQNQALEKEMLLNPECSVTVKIKRVKQEHYIAHGSQNKCNQVSSTGQVRRRAKRYQLVSDTVTFLCIKTRVFLITSPAEVWAAPFAFPEFVWVSLAFAKSEKKVNLDFVPYTSRVLWVREVVMIKDEFQVLSQFKVLELFQGRCV